MNFRWKFRFCPAINEHLSQEVISHKTRDNTTDPDFSKWRSKSHVLYCKRICALPPATLVYFNTMKQFLFHFRMFFFFYCSVNDFFSELWWQFLRCAVFVQNSHGFPNYICLRSSQKEVHWNSVHVASQQYS